MVKRYFAGAGVFLLPFIFEINAADQLRLPKAKFLCLMSMFYGAYLIGKKIDWPLGLFAAWVSVSAFFSSTGVPYQDILLFWGAILSGFWVVGLKDEELSRGIKMFITVSVILALYGFLQVAGKDPFLTYYAWAETWRPSVLFGQHTLYGPVAVAGFLSALFCRRYILSLVLLGAVLIIDSSFTFLSLAGGLALWAYWRLPKWMTLATLCSSCLLLGCLYLSSNKTLNEALNDKGRFKLWGQTLFLSKRHPIAGHGFGSFKEIYPIFQLPELRKANGIKDEEMSETTRKFFKEAEVIKAESGVFVSPHNDIVRVYFELGGIGVAIVLAMLLRFYLVIRRSIFLPQNKLLAAVFVSFLLNSLGSFPFRLVPQVLIPLWIYVIVVTRSDILRSK